MLEYDRIYISVGIDINKTKEYDIGIISIFQIKTLIMNPIFAMIVMI